jgi:hypothetical protein
MIPIMCLSLYGNCATDLRDGKMPNRRRNNKPGLEGASLSGAIEQLSVTAAGCIVPITQLARFSRAKAAPFARVPDPRLWARSLKAPPATFSP